MLNMSEITNEDIDLNELPCSTNYSKRNFYATLEILKTTRDDYVDLVQIHDAIVTAGVRDANSHFLLNLAESRDGGNQEQLCSYLRNIMRYVPLEKLYVALSLSNFGKVRDLVLLWKYDIPVRGIRKKELPYNMYVHRRYKTIKGMIDNNSFHGDVKQVLENLSARLTVRIDNLRDSDGEIEKAQKLLEEKVTIDLHRVQLYGSNDYKTRFEILENMKNTTTAGLDRCSLEMTLNSKLAVTYAKMGQFDEAQRHIRLTKELCESCLPSFATVLALNDIVYAFQEICFTNRTPETLNAATDCCELAYHIISCDDEDVHNQWKRIVLLFQAMAYLHISHEFEVGDISLVDKVSVKIANSIVSEVQSITHGIEIRRRMVLKMCQARIHERSSLNTALVYARQAYALSEEGCIRTTEKINIEKYVRFLTESQILQNNIAVFRSLIRPRAEQRDLIVKVVLQ